MEQQQILHRPECQSVCTRISINLSLTQVICRQEVLKAGGLHGLVRVLSGACPQVSPKQLPRLLASTATALGELAAHRCGSCWPMQPVPETRLHPVSAPVQLTLAAEYSSPADSLLLHSQGLSSNPGQEQAVFREQPEFCDKRDVATCLAGTAWRLQRVLEPAMRWCTR